MYKVLIVDDEQIVRLGLSNLINWQEEGYELLPTAKNGHEALSLIATHSPHIVITDLDMPTMHGLELLSHLKLHHPNIKTIILSNHGDMDLVHQSMNLGATDFLLKITISPEKLLDALRKVTANLPLPSFITSPPNNFLTILESICFEQTNHDTMLQAYNFGLGINHLIYISLDISHSTIENTSTPSYSFLKDALNSLIKETFCTYVNLYFFQVNQTDFLTILVNHNLSVEALQTKVYQFVHHAEIYANTYLYATLSLPFSDSQTLYTQFNNCQRSQDNYFYDSSYRVYTTPLLDVQEPLSKFLTPEIKNQIRYSLLDFNFSLTQQLTYELFTTLRSSKPSSLLVKQDLTDFLLSLLTYFNYPLKDELIIFKSILKLQEVSSLDRYITLFNEILTLLYEFILPLKSNKYRHEVCSIMEYINNNLCNKLSLSLIAKQINMSQSYVSRLFKAETGTTLINYINNMKMQQAKELLKNPAYMIKDIAGVLGFENQFYFNRIFNKSFGISPSTFQKNYHHSSNSKTG